MPCVECNNDSDTVTNDSIRRLLASKEGFVCQECNLPGPCLYMCLHRDCLFVGCSSNTSDHITPHDNDNSSHSLYLNLSTHKILCTKCQSELIIMEPNANVESDVDGEGECEENHVESRDSGRGSINFVSHVAEKMPTQKNGPWMGSMGDTSDSSDNEDRDSGIRNRLTGLVGLQNIGNTCYMNAALQALSNTAPLTNFFLECADTVDVLSEDRKPGLSRQYQTLMKDIWVKKNGGYVIPSGILYGIRNVHAMFRGYHQHDTQEFLRNFMDQLHEELKQLCPPECLHADIDNMSSTIDKPVLTSPSPNPSPSPNYDSSEGEYETCDSGVSERSSLSDDTERPPSTTNNNASTTKRRLSRSSSPGRRLRARLHSSPVIDSQPMSSTTNLSNRKQAKHRSIISDIFDGKLLSSVQCLTCDRVSSRVETFQDLSLPIPSRDHLVVLHGRGVPPGIINCASAAADSAMQQAQDGWISWILAWLKSWFYGPTVTLHDCLAAFFSTDELKGDNMYSCERCNKLRNGLKYSKVLQLPEVLCIHLKRFRHELMFSSKISAVVSFPLRGLDMRPYLHKDCVSQVTTYELFSVICHHGTAGAGHYTCYALNNGQWYEYDDQCVTRVHPDTVQNCEAYVLFYRKTLADSVSVKERVYEMQVNEEAAAATDTLTDLAFVSKQWLSRFKTCAEPGPIDNSDFACAHHLISPQRKDYMDKLSVAIPKKIYDFLHKKFGGSPAIATSAQVCPQCAALERRIRDESEEFRQLNGAFQYQVERPTHLISSSWFRQWKTFIEGRHTEPPSSIDNCTMHDRGAQTEDFIEINRDIWEFFYAIYGGGPELLIPLPEGQASDTVQDQDKADSSPVVEGLGKGEPMELDEEGDDGDNGGGNNNKEEVTVTLQSSSTPQQQQQQQQQNHSNSSTTNTSVLVQSDEDSKLPNGTVAGMTTTPTPTTSTVRCHRVRHRRKKDTIM